MKPIQERAVRFFGRVSSIYDALVFAPWMRSIQRRVCSIIKDGGKVLDIACGTGYALKYLSNELEDTRLYGVDQSEKMLLKASKKLVSNVVLKKADVKQLPFSYNFFNYVICTHAFNNFRKPLKVLKEVKRTLKPGGLFFVADFYSKHKDAIEKIFKKQPGFVKFYSPEEYMRYFRKSDIDVIFQKRTSKALITVGRA